MGNTGYCSIVCSEVVHFGHLCRLSADIWPSFCEHLWLPSRVLQPPRQVRVPQHGKGTSCRTVCVCAVCSVHQFSNLMCICMHCIPSSVRVHTCTHTHTHTHTLMITVPLHIRQWITLTAYKSSILRLKG